VDVTHVTLDAGPCPAGASETLGCRLQHLARLQRTLLRRALEEAGLHPGQEQVLTQLWTAGPQTQAELASALEIDTSTVSKTLARLERGGFVSRARSGDDRRAVTVSTTTQGDALRARIDGIIAGVDARLTAGLTADEQETLRALLSRVVANAHG
jgi:DNA-binding MarR family transcriptional regulator